MSKNKNLVVAIKDFLHTPKDFLSKLLTDELDKLIIQLHSKELYITTKEMFELAVRLEVRKERVIFEDKYRALKERFTKVKDNIDFDSLTKAQQTLIQLKNKLPIFKNMTTGEILTTTEKIQLLRMDKGERVFTLNNTTKEMFFLINGSVLFDFQGNIKTLHKNSFFGEIAYLKDNPREATATISSSSAIFLSFKIKEEINPNHSEAFMKLFKNMNSLLVNRYLR